MAIKPYDHTTYPSNGALGSSAALRNELDAIEAGFDMVATEIETALTGSETSAATATTQAGIATTQAGIATTQAGLATTNGAAQVSLATAQAGIATTQAGISTTQAGIATTKAGEALSSANSAAATLVTVNTVYDNFDDRYLGTKAAEPTLDNDGNALQVGTLYWDSTLNTLRGYNGAAWVSLPATSATAITNTPAGNLAATTVQAALNELDTEKLALAGGTLTGDLNLSSTAAISIAGNSAAGGQVTGIKNEKIVQSTVTSRYIGSLNTLKTQAAVFTLPNYAHYYAFQNALGAGSVVTSQTGFEVDTTLIGATTNIGFSGAISAGTGRWNLYMGGTAQNYLAGKLGIGVTVPTQELDVNGNGLFSGSLLVKAASGLGYTTGAGGSVTQATNKGTAVTINKPCGRITMNGAALASGATATFAVLNSVVSANDLLIVSNASSSLVGYRIDVRNVTAGAFALNVTNVSAGSLSEAVPINFAIIKGSAS